MNATSLRQHRRYNWIAVGLVVFVPLAVFAGAALGSELAGLLSAWTLIPIASFALAYAAPARPWRWPIIMACTATFVFWIAAMVSEAKWNPAILSAFVGPAILGVITGGLGSALRRSERARTRSAETVEGPNNLP